MEVAGNSALSVACQQIKMCNLVDTALRTSHVDILPVLRLGFYLSFRVLTARLQAAIKLPTFCKVHLIRYYINFIQYPIIRFWLFVR